MSADDPRQFWEPYLAPVPERSITCECGRSLDLPLRGEAECDCGRIYDRFGQLVSIVWPPRLS